MRTIKLTRGLKTKVDNEVFKAVHHFNWYALHNGNGNYYAARDVRIDGKKHTVLLHRWILKLLGSLEGEHENGDSLDNRVQNLRPATRSQNHANRKRLPKGKSSRFRGVSLHKQSGGFTAQISIGNCKKHLGFFKKAEDAARAYDTAAIAQFGQFAQPNFL